MKMSVMMALVASMGIGTAALAQNSTEPKTAQPSKAEQPREKAKASAEIGKPAPTFELTDTDGKVHWTYRLQGAFRAERLPNGNTMVVSMTQRTVSEVDRAGNRVWSKTCDGRPWVAHAR